VARSAEDKPVYEDKQLVIWRTTAPRGLSLMGVIDHFNVDSFARSLDSSLDGQGGDLNLDLSRLEFCDVSGIRALVKAAEKADGGRRLVINGLPPQIRTVMTVVGWANLPGLVIKEPDR
jgi:anti-anti-sigma factor